MKRNLIIFTIICLSLILFTGCDEILEAFYPEFGQANNEILITVDIDNSIEIGIETPIMVAIVPFDGNLIIDRMWAQDHYDRHIEADFYPLPGETAYKVLVWRDANNNGKPDQDEPSIQVMHGDGWYIDDLFDFRTKPGEEAPPDYIEASAVLNNWDKMDFAILQQFANYVPDGSDDGGEFIDLSFQIEGPFTISKGNAPNDSIYKIRPASDATIIDVYGGMLSPDNQEIAFSESSYDGGRKEIHINFNSISWVGETSVSDLGLSDPAVPPDMRLHLELEYDLDGDGLGDEIAFNDFWIHFTTSDDEAPVGTLYKLNIELERLGDYPLILAADQSYPCRAEIMRFNARTGQYEPSGRVADGTINGGFGHLEILNVSYKTPELDFVHVLIWEPGADKEIDPPFKVSDDISIYLGKDQPDAFVFFDPWSFQDAGPKTSEDSEGTPAEPILLYADDSALAGKVGYNESSFYKVAVDPDQLYEIAITGSSGDIDLGVFENGYEGINPGAMWLTGAAIYSPATSTNVVAVTGTNELYIQVYGWDDQITYNISVISQAGSGFVSEGTAGGAVELIVGENLGKTVGDLGLSYYAIPTVQGNTYEINLTNITSVIDAYIYAYDGPSLSYGETSYYELAEEWIEPGIGSLTFTVTSNDDYVIFLVYNYGGGGSYDITEIGRAHV